MASALWRSKSSRIHLYLDDDEGFESSTNPHIGWLASHPRVIIHNFKLSEWLRDAIGATRWTGPAIARRLARRVLNRWVPSRISLSLSRLTAIRHLVGHYHSHFAWFPNMSHQHVLRSEGLAHRAGVFRILITIRIPRESVFYSGLGVYFAALFTKWDFRSPFTYKWGTETWANTAICFFPKKKIVNPTDTLSAVRSHPALHWFLFSLENCLTFGTNVLPAGSFDPGWTTGSAGYRSNKIFFQNNEFSTAFVKEFPSAFLGRALAQSVANSKHQKMATAWHRSSSWPARSDLTADEFCK